MVEIIEEADRLVIRIDGQEYAQYHYGPTVWKPYLYPLRAANGLSLLDDAPTDHRHHHGLWVGHGRVDDADFWLERHKSGKIVHKGFETWQGDGVGGFTERCDWVDWDGKLRLTDTRTFTFHVTPVEARIFDFEIALHAPGDAPVQLHPTNEAGLPSLRIATDLTVKRGGALTNAEGQQRAGSQYNTYGKRSPFLDCSGGKLGRLVCGVAVFDHPDNPAHPPHWFTRDYGPVSPNEGFFQPDPISILPGEPLRLRYRIYSHSGDMVEGHVAAQWEAYRATTL